MKFIFIALLPIIIVLGNFSFNKKFLHIYTSENVQDLISDFYFLLLISYIINFIFYLMIKLIVSKDEYCNEEMKILYFSLISAFFAYLFIGISDGISQNDDPRLSIQPVKFNTKDMVVYSDEVIKFCNPNLTNSEIKIIKDEITFFEYLPIFLEFQEHKNALSEKQRKADIKAYKKAEREKKLAEKQAKKAEKEKRQQIKKDFLSQKCKGAEKC